MGPRFVNLDRDTPLLLPPNLRDWVPADHLAPFVVDGVEALDLCGVKVNVRGAGDEQYPPSMMLALSIYSYATGTFGSRRMEQSTCDNVAVRLITADTHPDHDTICTFRRENQARLRESLVKVLQMAHRVKVLKFGQLTVSVDGTKVLANASKHAAVSYDRAGQTIQQLELEVQQLIDKAEQADATPLAAVEVDSRLIVGERVSQSANDKQELVPTVAAIPPAAGSLAAVLTDSGFFSEAAVKQIEQTPEGAPRGTTVYAPLDKKSHHRSVADWEQKPQPEAPPEGASVSEVMRHRLKTGSGKALYMLRQQTVEPGFGVIKAGLGFRQFLLRGAQKVSLEWTLVCLAYNFRRLHTLGVGAKLAGLR